MQTRWGGWTAHRRWPREREAYAVPRLQAGAGYRLGDRSLVDGTVMMLTDPFSQVHRGVTAEKVASRYDVPRGEQDEFAPESQHRAASERRRAASAEEITPVQVGGRRPVVVDADEHPRPENHPGGVGGATTGLRLRRHGYAGAGARVGGCRAGG